jgi:chaperonin cofactor prefoldin
LNSWEINYDSSVQPSVDKINEISSKYLACAILVVEENYLLLEDDYRDEFEFIYNHLDEFECGDEIKETDNSSMFTVDNLSDELKQLIETLSPIQQTIICVILNRLNISLQLEEIANAELSMPEILIDEINDISSQIIGDILIDTFSDEICVLEQYENELKDAMK